VSYFGRTENNLLEKGFFSAGVAGRAYGAAAERQTAAGLTREYNRGVTVPGTNSGSFAPKDYVAPDVPKITEGTDGSPLAPQYQTQGDARPIHGKRDREVAQMRAWNAAQLAERGVDREILVNYISTSLDRNFERYRPTAERMADKVIAYVDAANKGRVPFPANDPGEFERQLSNFLLDPPKPVDFDKVRTWTAAVSDMRNESNKFRVEEMLSERRIEETIRAIQDRPEPPALTKAQLKEWDKTAPVPDRLPELHNHVFQTRGSAAVWLDDIIPTKSAAETLTSSENAAKRLGGAMRRELPRRPPLTVRLRDDGRYDLLDGNSTYAALKRYGWQRVPVTTTSGEQFAVQTQLPL
jgi:hypothetical protein